MNTVSESLPGTADVRIISLISIAHGFSHFYQLALPPLFPLLHRDEGYSFTELGSLIGIYYLVSGLVQPVAGFVVDRIGPRPVLYLGLVFCALACAGYALVNSYAQFVALVILAGLGNGVFHPCDYTALSHNVSERRVGRGFSFHAFGGYIGYAIAPVTMIGLATWFGWREALLLAGLTGLLFVPVLFFAGHSVIQVVNDITDVGRPRSSTSINVLLSPVIIGCFAFFCAIAMAQIGLQTFAPSALLNLYDTAVAVSNTGVTIFLVAVTVGILAGGVLADHTSRHHLVATLCLIPPALLALMPGWFELSVPLLWGSFGVMGFVFGLLIPSRDMIVRAAAPRHSSGKIFGVVYSGLDVGSALTPIAFGWLLDKQLATWVFFVVGACFASGIVAIAASRISPPPA